MGFPTPHTRQRNEISLALLEIQAFRHVRHEKPPKNPQDYVWFLQLLDSSLAEDIIALCTGCATLASCNYQCHIARISPGLGTGRKAIDNRLQGLLK